MDNRLSNLERRGSATDNAREQFQVRMEDFRKSQIEKEQQSRGQYAEIYATIDRIQEEIQSLNGKLEEKQHDSMQRSSSAGGGDSIEARLNNVEQTTASFRDRLARIEEYLSVDGGARKSAIGKTDSEKPPAKDKPESAPSAELSENDLYAKAKQEFDAGDLDTARTGFQEFLKRYPKSSIAESAQFWIGEIYYRQKSYEKAILEYQKVIETYPKGNKIQASLLKQGISFYNLGDKANARLILKELITKYPSSSEAKIAKQKLERS